MAGIDTLLRGSTAAIALFIASAGGSGAQDRPTANLYGMTGLIDMPSGEMQPDGELNFTLSRSGATTRTTLAFQIAPRLQGSFRYTGTRGLGIGGFAPTATYYDRSFDLRYQVLTEGLYWPAVTVGLQDFAGTGNFAAEYIAATKTFGSRVKVTGGLGWGRLGSYNSIGSPLGVRPAAKTATGGNFNANQWFRGPAAPFGGIEWQVNDRLGLKVEYSSDAYTLEQTQGVINRRSPLNFGAEYQIAEGIRLGAYYMYGSELGITAQIALNPKKRAAKGIYGPAGIPIQTRPDRRSNPDDWSPDWVQQADAAQTLRDNLARQLATDDLVLESLSLSSTQAELRVRNPRYDAGPQAIGRAARALAATMPASVEIFDIVPVVNGIPAAKIRLRRSDLESLEHAPDNANALRARAQVLDAGRLPRNALMGEQLYPKFSWSIRPYTRFSFFDPAAPLRADAGLRFTGSYDLARGVVLSGSVTAKVAGNLDQYNKASNSVLPHVRTDGYLYDRTDIGLENLTLAWYSRPGPNLYGRVTAGYLERMYGGVSGELLWKPVDSRLALGVEVNYVKQ
ncbi:MAG: YjbH domain-containing protein, partial [Gemmobacter sp.]|nr:YjbH domain-containing protein [Gemmobacter sp.]